MTNILKKAVVALLTWEARITLARHRPRIIAVTGSVGKTTTKDAIYAALAEKLHMRKSIKSFNSDIGVPLTILGLPNAASNPFGWAYNIVRGLFSSLFSREYPAWLVLEVGADRPGDIRRIAGWLRPDIAIITGVPDMPVHVEYFKSPDELLKEKKSLAEYLRPGGKLIVCGDEHRMREVAAEFRGAAVTYGFDADCDFYASHESVLYEGERPLGIQFRVNHSDFSMPAEVHGALGRPRILAALAAFAVASEAGVDPVSVARGIAGWVPPPGRVRLIAGERGSVIIDDSYNSSPAAAFAALDTLAGVRAKRRIAILGDMLELGRFAAEAHRLVGERAATSCDMLIAVGLRARGIAEAARSAGMPESAVRHYEHGESARAGDELEEELREGDIVLVKGSQSMRMEKTVLEMMAEPERAPDLLVRMDPEWQFR